MEVKSWIYSMEKRNCKSWRTRISAFRFKDLKKKKLDLAKRCSTLLPSVTVSVLLTRQLRMTLPVDLMLFAVYQREMLAELKLSENSCWSIGLDQRELKIHRAIIDRDVLKVLKLIRVFLL